MTDDSLHPQHPSPDGNHRVELTYEHELRFGPAFYRLEIDGFDFGERYFWRHVAWSPDSRFVVLPESTGRYNSHGQDYWQYNQLVVFDVVNRQEAKLSEFDKGWIVPRNIEANVVLYYKEPKPHLRYEFERDLATVTQWEDYSTKPKLTRKNK